jgi:hypothetical protein
MNIFIHNKLENRLEEVASPKNIRQIINRERTEVLPYTIHINNNNELFEKLTILKCYSLSKTISTENTSYFYAIVDDEPSNRRCLITTPVYKNIKNELYTYKLYDDNSTISNKEIYLTGVYRKDINIMIAFGCYTIVDENIISVACNTYFKNSKNILLSTKQMIS